MTVCKKCGGTGEINVPVTEHLGRVLYGKEQCDACDGTGEVQTNEEWFCQLSTDEKAYFLSVEAVRSISEYENNGTERTCSSFWEYWLKAVHKE